MLLYSLEFFRASVEFFEKTSVSQVFNESLMVDPMRCGCDVGEMYPACCVMAMAIDMYVNEAEHTEPTRQDDIDRGRSCLITGLGRT